MCRSKKIKEKLLSLYREKVGPIAGENDEIPILERDAFKKAIQLAYPDLRYRNINGLVTINDFANKIEKEQVKKQEFFDKALNIICEVSGHPEYTLDSVLFEECLPQHSEGNKKLSEEANYFIKCQKVYYALAKMTPRIFTPKSTALENTKNLASLIDVYYREGRF